MNTLSRITIGLLLCFSAIAHSMESDRTQPTKRSYEDISEQSEINNKIQKLELKENKDQYITLVGKDDEFAIMKKSIARLSPTIEEILNVAEENKESLENGIPFNKITGLQLQKIATILNNSVEYYGYEQVKIDLKGRIKKDDINKKDNVDKKDGIDKEHETQYFLDDTIIKYLALHKGSPSLTPDLYDIFNSFDLPLFKWVLGAKARESRMNLPFILTKSEISSTVTEYLVDDNFKKIENYIYNNSNIVSDNTNKQDALVSPDKKYYLKIEPTQVSVVKQKTNEETFLFNYQFRSVNCIWAPNSKYVLIILRRQDGRLEKCFFIWDADTKEITSYKGPSTLNLIAEWSANSQYVTMYTDSPKTSETKTLQILDFYSDEIILSFNVPLHNISWSPDSQHITVAHQNTVDIIHIPTCKILKTLGTKLEPWDEITHQAWSPDSHYLGLSGFSQKGRKLLFELHALENGCINKIELENTILRKIAWLSDSTGIIGQNTAHKEPDALLSYYHIANNKLNLKFTIKNLLNSFSSWNQSFVCSPDNEYLITTIPQSLRIVSLLTGTYCAEIKLLPGVGGACSFQNPDKLVLENWCGSVALNYGLLKRIFDYFDDKIFLQEIVLLNAIQAARAKNQLYSMGADSLRIFNGIAENDPEVGNAIRNALLPLITFQ